MDQITLSPRHLHAFAEVGFQVAGRRGIPGAMRALREVIALEAYEFVAYDPVTGRHRSLVSDGYTRVDGDAAEEYVRLDPYRRAMDSRVPLPMGVPGTERYFRRHLEPYGWRAGLTTPLFLTEGRYTGLLHLNSRDPGAFSAEASTMISAVSPTLAHVTDLSRCVVDSVGTPPGFHAAAFDRSGTRRDVTGTPASAAVAAEPRMAELAREFIDSRELNRRGLWLDGTGQWREVRLLRAGVGPHGAIQGAVIAERPCAPPYDLTGREVEVITRVALGDSNPQIAAALVLSVRTVTTHLEHIFAKLGCESRTRLTTRALAEGLCRLPL
ncbi:LuxR C-terminal-related transcriptional regulator [Streptosporangium sp. NBC_01756]|uniref:LuxR C-terminal-related transcriptional regulator n=1 Tax=Streptosporangium sp. NBC_01756 TaxID=2975950 RepID=UPI002DD7DBC1|nr:LuxR C-terminal-related transcriptional regulator [Streptosporangium sp. NBC_01756]WSC85426.1 LuxR C-terminal-related transcriptional regulator [Streptosporangium sp. NBC_01756]